MKKRKLNKNTKKYLHKLEKREIKRQFKEWSTKVKERDGNHCVICQSTNYIHTHHLFPREIHELRFEIDNGITLCAKHHKYSLEISAHKNPIAFLLWITLNRKEQLMKLLEKYKEIKK